MDVSKEAGLVDVSWSGDASAVDVNDDGWLDLYVVNMQGDDRVLRERRRQDLRQEEP